MNAETIADRLKSLVPYRQKSESARKCGIAQKTFSSYLEGTEPTASKLVQLANGLGVDLRWLATGEGSQDVAAAAAGSARHGEQVPPMADLTMVERLAVEASAGHGALVDNEHALDFVAFQTRWLRRKGINPAAVRLLNIRGDSMEPTIRDGDIALVDTSIADIIDNAIYVLVVGNRLLIKRIHILMSGALRLISDNVIYPHEDVPASEAEFVRVSGRVVWFGRSI